MGLFRTVIRRLIGRPRVRLLAERTTPGKLHHWFSLVHDERKKGQHMDEPLSRRLWLYRRGFFRSSHLLYDLEHGDHRDYLPDSWRYLRTSWINEPFSEAMNNKLFTYWLLGDRSERLPALHGVCSGRTFYPLGDDLTVEGTPRGIGRALDPILREENRLVAKGLRGGGADSIFVLEWDGEDGEYRLGGEQVPYDALVDRLASLGNWILTSYVSQAPYSAALYRHSVNTIRVVTMIDPETGEAFVPIAVHRIGTPRSGTVDNWSKGGLSAEIDVETGVLGRAVQFPYDGELRWQEDHPTTGAEIEGTAIPGWDSIRSDLLSIAESIPYVPYVGWDLAIVGRREFEIIEVNANTDVDLLQVHRPLLQDERIERFYRHHDVIE